MSQITKENVDPLQKSKTSKLDDDPDNVHIKKIIETYENNIAKTPTDCIDLWINYLKWFKELHTNQQVTKKQVKDLYYKAIDSCKKVRKYVNDPRFYQIFLEYLDYEEKKLVWMEWMYNHNYFVKLSNFYIKWSNLLEPTEVIRSFKVLLLAKNHELDSEQRKLLDDYISWYRCKFDTEEATENKEDTEILKPELAFNYKLLTGPNCVEEYQFEECRARLYKKLYNESQVILNENQELKKKLAEFEAKQIKAPAEQKETTNNSVWIDNTTTQKQFDKTQFTNRKSWLCNTYNTTIGFNNTNFTDVTQLNDNNSDMSLTDDEIEVKEDKSLQPLSMQSTLHPPPDLSLATTQDITTSITLANIKNSMMNTFSDTTLANREVTIKTSEARKIVENMFNQTYVPNEDEQTDITNSIDKTNADTLPSIAIYKDNQTLSEQTSSTTKINKTFEQLNDENNENDLAKRRKARNVDGSLFIYDQSKLNNSNIENKQKRLRVLVDSIPDMSSFTGSINQIDEPTTNFTNKHIEFEPPAASTRSIKPLLNRMNDFNNLSKLETIIDSSFELAVKNEEMDQKNCLQEEEKEKLLNAHLNTKTDENEEKNLSKLLDQDFMTQATKWSNCMTQNQNKTNKQVKFSANVIGSVTKKNITRSNATNVNSSAISWDYDYLEVEKSTNTTANQVKDSNQTELKLNLTQCQTLADLTIPNLTISEPAIEVIQNNELTEIDIEEKNKFLTQEKLEQTFNNDYYKLFYNQSILNNTSLNVSKVMLDKFIDEEDEDEVKEDAKEMTIVEEEQEAKIEVASNQSILQNRTISQVNEKKSSINYSNLNTSKINYEKTLNTTCQTTTNASNDITNYMNDSSISINSYNHDGSSNNSISISSSSITVSMTKPNLNETIMTAIREPFNIEVKNRLLDKGPLENLKTNPNFVSLKIDCPFVSEKTLIAFKDGSEFKIIKEIGKGSFAKIYLIQNNKTPKELKALKVDKQATSWEFYITETLHERLNKMLNDKTMKVNVISSYIRMNQFMKYKNGCFSAMDYYSNGSLLDLINFHVLNEKTYPKFPYWFVLYLTLEMLYIIEYLHKAKIIHADIKPDNLLVYKLPDSANYFDPNQTKCLVLIDYNRSIDLNLFGENTEFGAKVDNKSLLIPEMKEEKPWTYQVDFYGILCSIHCIVFKRYMETYRDKQRIKFNGKFPREYDQLFDDLFDTYLNVPSCNEFPNLDEQFIINFKKLFLNELGSSFMKSKQYLQDLNNHFNKKK